MKQTILKVDGMTCGSCESAVKKGLQEIKGIGEVLVNLAEKEVTIHHEEIVALETITEAIENLGFDVME